VYRRYGYAVKEMSDRRARELVGVDQTRDPAFGIFEVEGCRQLLHAVGRYFADGEGGAECAFVTRECKRGAGMGSLLLRLLVTVARLRGLQRVWAQVQADNGPMLGLFRAHGFALHAEPGGDTVEASLPLRSVPTQKRRRNASR
jgi:ribosomal protein S18 acetylase RimI-like enzyme